MKALVNLEVPGPVHAVSSIVHIPDSSKRSESILMRMIDRLLIRGPPQPYPTAPTSIYSTYGLFHQDCLLISHDSRGPP